MPSRSADQSPPRVSVIKASGGCGATAAIPPFTMLHGVEEGRKGEGRGKLKEQLRILVEPMINVRRNDLISENIENFNSNELMRIESQVFIYRRIVRRLIRITQGIGVRTPRGVTPESNPDKDRC